MMMTLFVGFYCIIGICVVFHLFLANVLDK